MNTIRSIFKLIALFVLGLSLASCGLTFAKATPTPLPPTATSTTVPTPTRTSTATKTLIPTFTRVPTATLNATATQQYNDMFDFVASLQDDGYLDTTDGVYHSLDDYSKQWAQLDWYLWSNTDYQPKDFVLRAHMAWSSDIETPNPSGCGVVFHIQPSNDHYVIFLQNTGYVQFGIIVNRNWQGNDWSRWGKAQNKGEADFAMTSVGSKIDVFVNGKHIKRFTGFQSKMTDGVLGFTVLSGTNAGYGTECDITNADLWMLY